MDARSLLACALAALSCAAGAQISEPLAPSRPSVPSGPSTPRELGPDGTVVNPMTTPSTPQAAPQARTGRTTGLLGAGAFGTTSGLENVLNSGTPPAWDRKGGPRKVCPPELENRDNVCVAPVGSVLSR
jgi:hypothetical protein